MLKYEQRKQKPPRQSTYSPTYGQHRKHPPSSAPPGKTPHKEATEEATEEVEEAVEAAEEAETPLLPQEVPLQAQVMEEVEETIDSSDNPRMYSQETAPGQRSSSRNGNSIITSTTSRTSWEYPTQGVCYFSRFARDRSW